MLSICIVFAQLERETIQQRVRDAYRARCRKGFYMGGRIPFGYRLEPYILDGKRTARYVVEESEADILRYLFREYAAPLTSLADLVEKLEAAGAVVETPNLQQLCIFLLRYAEQQNS
jgi:DNA invertase Pin-like site-specific DNA recombinase